MGVCRECPLTLARAFGPRSTSPQRGEVKSRRARIRASRASGRCRGTAGYGALLFRASDAHAHPRLFCSALQMPTRIRAERLTRPRKPHAAGMTEPRFRTRKTRGRARHTPLPLGEVEGMRGTSMTEGEGLHRSLLEWAFAANAPSPSLGLLALARPLPRGER